MGRPAPPQLIIHADSGRFEIVEAPAGGATPIRLSAKELKESRGRWRARDSARRFRWEAGKPPNAAPGLSPEQQRQRRRNWEEQGAIAFYAEKRRTFGLTKNGQEEYERRAFAEGVNPWCCDEMQTERASYFVSSAKAKSGPKPPNENDVHDWAMAIAAMTPEALRAFLARQAPGLPWNPRRSPRNLALLLSALWSGRWKPSVDGLSSSIAEEYRKKIEQLANADQKRRAGNPGGLTT